MDTMISVWTMVEHVRVASGAAELAIFTAILYWFFTSSRVADMLEVVGERVGGWCGRDTSSSLRQAVRARRRHNQYGDVYSKIDADVTARTTSLYRVKEGPVVPAPQPQTRPPAGLACARCAPLSRDSWQEPKTTDTGSVINILDIGRQNFANGGVVSRYLCDLAQCCQLQPYEYPDIVPNVIKDENVQRSIEECVQEELEKMSEGKHNGGGDGKPTQYDSVRKRVEARAYKVIHGISSAMSTSVLRLVAWVCHVAVRRVAVGGCGTRAAGIARVRRANAAGLPLVFVPLHRSHFDYILVTFALYLTGVRPPLVAAGDNMRIPFFGWFLRGCGAFYIRRRMEGSDYHSDPIYKSALRAYILNGLAAKNNLEFFIEGGRTRTGKPQTPKAGILSVIMDAYLDGTIDDALLVPVTLNYDKLVDGNFVREQLGMPKQMETFWSALRGIWRTLNTNHGSIRVDFNQPISLKELVTSFQRYNHYKAPIESPLTPPNNNLAVNLDRQILYNHSYSSFYGADVSTDHKIMVEAIGRHLVYDASQASPLMCTNVVAYVLLTELRGGGTVQRLQQLVERRAAALQAAGRDLGYSGELRACLNHALDMLGRGLVRREGSGARQLVKPQLSIAASLELAYYANTVVAHYAAPAVLATALETIIVESSYELEEVRHSTLIETALQLCAVLSLEFIFCAPCQRIEEKLHDALDSLVAQEVLAVVQPAGGLEEQQWSRRFAARLDDELEHEHEREHEHAPLRDPAANIKYKILNTDAARAERRRLVVSVRPLLEAYAATCRRLQPAPACRRLQPAPAPANQLVKDTLDHLTDDFSQNRMIYGEAVSTDAISNCLRLLRQWGVLQLHSRHKQRELTLCEPYHTQHQLDDVTHNITKFNVDTPLLRDK